jgi:hypothetical protein
VAAGSGCVLAILVAWRVLRLIAGMRPQVFLGEFAVGVMMERLIAQPARGLAQRGQAVLFGSIPVPRIANLGSPNAIKNQPISPLISLSCRASKRLAISSVSSNAGSRIVLCLSVLTPAPTRLSAPTCLFGGLGSTRLAPSINRRHHSSDHQEQGE